MPPKRSSSSAPPKSRPMKKHTRTSAPSSSRSDVVQDDPEPTAMEAPLLVDTDPNDPTLISHDMGDDDAQDTDDNGSGSAPVSSRTRFVKERKSTKADNDFLEKHPLIEHYPHHLVKTITTDGDGDKPVIDLPLHYLRKQVTPLGWVTVVELPCGRVFCDARETIALSDGKNGFDGYIEIQTKENRNHGYNINSKWNKTLSSVPVIYFKFPGMAAASLPFVDDLGYMDILYKGKGHRAKCERHRHRRMVSGIYANDKKIVSEIKEDYMIDIRRDSIHSEFYIFIKGHEFRMGRGQK